MKKAIILLIVVTGMSMFQGCEKFLEENPKSFSSAANLSNSKSGLEVQSKIKQQGEALKSELQNKQDEIKGMQEKYKRESVILSDEQKVRKEREIRAELNEYRVLQNQNTQKFNKIRSELINNVRKTIVDLAEKMGKSKGYMLIIERQSGTVLYAKDTLDITNQFVSEIDKQKK